MSAPLEICCHFDTINLLRLFIGLPSAHFRSRSCSLPHHTSFLRSLAVGIVFFYDAQPRLGWSLYLCNQTDKSKCKYPHDILSLRLQPPVTDFLTSNLGY